MRSAQKQTGVWIPAFAGMTGGDGNDDGRQREWRLRISRLETKRVFDRVGPSAMVFQTGPSLKDFLEGLHGW